MLTLSSGKSACGRLVSVLLLSTAIAVSAPASGNAAVLTALTLTVAGISIIADFGGAAATLQSIFGDKLDDLSDDHPLYSAGQASPRLAISASNTTFNFQLSQENDVSEFEDDKSAQLSGITTVDGPTGAVQMWEWFVTIEADVNSLSIPQNTELDVDLGITHIGRPHPNLNEGRGTQNLADMEVEKTAGFFGFDQSTIRDSATGQPPHDNGPHFDVMAASLKSDCCSTVFGDIDDFVITARVEHGACNPQRRQRIGVLADEVCALPAIPIPAAAPLYLSLAGLLALIRWRGITRMPGARHAA